MHRLKVIGNDSTDTLIGINYTTAHIPDMLESIPIVKHNKSTFTLCWFYLQEDFQEILNRHDFDDQKKFDFQNDFLLLFDFLSPSVKTEVHENAVKKIKNSKSLQKVFTKFHQKGLVIF